MPFGGLLSAGIGAAGSLFGGLFGGSAASKASQQYVQQLQKGQSSLQNTENQVEGNYQPYMTAGAGATSNLSRLLATPGQGLLTPWTQSFQAPTAAQAEQTPGYQFQLQAGLGAAQNSAAGQGSLLSGRTLADLNNYAQGTASTNYQNTFNNALTGYQTAYQSFQNNQQNEYSRLMGLSGQGLQAAGGASSAETNLGGDIASLYGQMGAAQAQGTIGKANAYGGMFQGIGNSISNGLMLNSLNGGSSGAMPAFNGGSIGGTYDSNLGTPGYMPGGAPVLSAPSMSSVLGNSQLANPNFLSSLQ